MYVVNLRYVVLRREAVVLFGMGRSGAQGSGRSALFAQAGQVVEVPVGEALLLVPEHGQTEQHGNNGSHEDCRQQRVYVC